jgi:hypothetical protein
MGSGEAGCPGKGHSSGAWSGVGAGRWKILRSDEPTLPPGSPLAFWRQDRLLRGRTFPCPAEDLFQGVSAGGHPQPQKAWFIYPSQPRRASTYRGLRSGVPACYARSVDDSGETCIPGDPLRLDTLILSKRFYTPREGCLTLEFRAKGLRPRVSVRRVGNLAPSRMVHPVFINALTTEPRTSRRARVRTHRASIRASV